MAPGVHAGSGRDRAPVDPLSATLRRRRLAAVVVAAAVIATVALAVLSSVGGVATATDVPPTTTVTVVRGGESLVDVARRTAPGADPGAVVEWMRDVNALPSVSVAAGRPLVVPVDPDFSGGVGASGGRSE